MSSVYMSLRMFQLPGECGGGVGRAGRGAEEEGGRLELDVDQLADIEDRDVVTEGGLVPDRASRPMAAISAGV